QAKKVVSYSIASVSGAILAVCSCTILPLFAGIRKRGAGLGPAVTFLFSGPAINIAAIFLTISVLGLNIGLARIISAIFLSILVGLTMQFIFREKTEEEVYLFKKISRPFIVRQLQLYLY
ncbi:MAG: permease, partial [Candidatus Moranbacteria bacterium]|nr:permease [Candidatus Moranbacteria bacterium]